MTLTGIKTFLIPREAQGAAEAALREAGDEGFELFVLWSGRVEADVFTVQTTHVPEQQSYRLDSGVCVRVGGDALHRLNVWLLEHSQTLGVQVHTHPNRAYHSPTDDSFPIVTALGGLSLVTPDFCRRGLFSRGHVIYRLGWGGWSPVAETVVAVI